ncbi:DUF3018 family protein [Tardiphaga sp. vice352]|uniref:antitoxin MazE family protein n=1 Tax=unclassified Tardiphaga TaxID=2631404 RepID=UPI001164FE69|nr:MULTISPECIES: antitoxin MazE family protein [unclassified Tardiphaga]MBC7582550.1 antitoxin MazE family protein [Tardiphaga sp.]QDM18427.1 DUF3018 family protein [Tardiphaga sp. vice278]QDM23429.1 DUF3018 family protein [Tardiphaga sp. vice154]QDM28650.1 DUF3018 family protein [Tardiphaga sp. vice304]QDM33751.1 DUF3018 family protein [Tardiphaga sp. vice352]
MSDGARRVRKHREKMKAAGLKPVTIWVPDVNAPGYAEDIRRQCLILRNDPQEQQILAEIEQLFDAEGWK